VKLITNLNTKNVVKSQELQPKTTRKTIFKKGKLNSAIFLHTTTNNNFKTSIYDQKCESDTKNEKSFIKKLQLALNASCCLPTRGAEEERKRDPGCLICLWVETGRDVLMSDVIVLRTSLPRRGLRQFAPEIGNRQRDKSTYNNCNVCCFAPVQGSLFLVLNEYSCRLRLIALSGDVHPNPGPKSFHVHKKTNLVIMTYNVQGLKNFKKMKRVNNFLHKLNFSKNVIINLQETHLCKQEITKLEYQWKWGSCHSTTENNSGGVSILYNKNYFDEIIKTKNDLVGRKCALYAKRDDETYFFVNIYAPNDHYEAVSFYKEVEEWVNEAFELDSTINIVISGDFNFVFEPEVDSIGRHQSNQESKVRDQFRTTMTKFNLKDSFRMVNEYGGYTWGRDNPTYIKSRLDYVIASQNLINSLISSNVNIQPNESDHKVVYSEFEIDKVPYGPGIIRVNSNLFNNPVIKETIISKLKSETIGAPLNWNPHTKLDYAKHKLREIMLFEGKKLANYNKTRLEYANEEINNLDKKLESLLAQGYQDGNHLALIDRLRESIYLAESDIEDLKNEESERLIFRSRAKWAEKGEKSNKYFLNLLKVRQKAMIIRKIISNGVVCHKQDEISKAITKFYKELYKKQPDIKKPDDNRLFKDLPKLNSEQREMLDKPLSLDEIRATLNTCEESAPGPDGITYKTYCHTWEIMGPLILNSWTYSQGFGSTSPSQRNAVITLLEKKGKDKSKIENLRPISLSNCDIKLCTKTLALRTNKVLPYILSVTQTGYIPGKHVNDNSRLLEEIINKYKETNEQAYLITLDARKAFDSVDHEYLLHILGLFGFPPNYINSVKTIYNNLNASVLVNGFTREMFDIEQSVKQGDALSCALFIIAVEPLLRQINKNKNIKGIELTSDNSDDQFNLKDMSFADDITALCRNIEGIQHIIDEYLNFSEYSGIKLNIEKTEILIIGKKTNGRKVFNIKYNNQIIKIVESNKVKICGITFTNNEDIAYNENILEKIDKLERQLNIWRQRNLTLQGKILIVKTFGISQLIYSLQATIIKLQDLKKIEDLIFRFIWSIKASNPKCIGKIRRDVLKSNIDKGGLRAPDIEMINRSIKLKHIIRCMKGSHPISIITKNELLKINFGLCKFRKVKKSSSPYIQNVVETNIQLEKLLEKDIKEIAKEQTGINYYYYNLIQTHILNESSHFSIHMNNMLKRLKQKGINTLIDLHRERYTPTNPTISLDCFLVYSKVPESWKQLLVKSRKVHLNLNNFSYALNKSKEINQIKQREIYNRLTENLGIQNITSFLNTKHNLNENNIEHAFSNIKRMTSIKSLQNVQYKLLHNIYPTQIHLYKWKIKDNDKCSYCDQTETLKHAIFDCNIASSTLRNAETIMNVILKTNLSLTYTDVLVGLSVDSNYNSINKKMKLWIDEILIIIKRKLILQRENKRIITTNEIETLISGHNKLLNYIDKTRIFQLN